MPSLAEIVERADALKALDLECCSKEDVASRLKDFLSAASYDYGPLGVELKSVGTWHRCRPLKPGELIQNNLEGLIYPNLPSGKYGRLNYPDQRVLYASVKIATVLAEVEECSPMTRGDKVEFITCRPRFDGTV